MNKIANLTNAIRANINSQLFGCDSAIELVLCALIAEGHVMVEDVPGLGKTSLAKALAASICGSFKRIQFTPDLMPSDIMGTEILDENRKFKFVKGPIFANIVWRTRSTVPLRKPSLHYLKPCRNAPSV